MHHCRLHRGVGGVAHGRAQARDRRHVHDRGAPRLLQKRLGRGGGADRRQQIDVDAGAPRGLVAAHPRARRVVDEHVDAAERLGCAWDVARDLARAREVAALGVHALAELRELRGDTREILRAARAQRDAGARLGERARDRAPDAAAAAAHDHARTAEVDAHLAPHPSSKFSPIRFRTSPWCSQYWRKPPL